MQHTHGFQNQSAGPQVQAAAANEVARSPEPGTYSRQQAKAFPERQGHPERKRESDDAYTNPTNHALDTIFARPAKRNKEFTGEYAKLNTTTTPQDDIPASGSRNAASRTINEAEKSVLTNASFSSVAQTTHGFHPRAAEAHDSDSLTYTSPSQSDTKKCIQVGRDTYAVTSQPGTSYTFNPGIDTGTFQGKRLQPVTNPAEHTTHEVTRRKSTKPQKPHRHQHRRHKPQGRSIDTFSSASRS